MAWNNYRLPPKIQMAFFLVLIAVSAVLFGKRLLPLLVIGLSLSTAIGVDLLLIRLRNVGPFLPSAAIVSGLIIGLLFSPALPWYQVVIASAASMVIKNFLRFDNKHIFNPASSGLFLSGVLFGHSISWWGVSFQTLQMNFASLVFFLILLSPGYVSMIAMRRYKILFSFMLTYILLAGTLQLLQHDFSIRALLTGTLLDPTTVFFGLVMLPEPMTTPGTPSRQILFGSFVAIAVFLASFIHSRFIPDPLLAGLLIGNLLFFKFR